MSQQWMFEEMFRGQAFVPCNGFVPRYFQYDCLRQYREFVTDCRSRPVSFVIYAGPGSGKTKLSALLASDLLNNTLISQIIIVVPNKSIRAKTKKDFAHFFGIHLAVFNKQKHKDGIPRMQQGYILTYGALMNDPSLHQTLCKNSKTLVIFDEIHHLSDGNDWGRKSLQAFGEADYVIGLTGTPWTSDGKRIPFVVYENTDVDGIQKFKAHFTYNVGQSVNDGWCRKPIFGFFDGQVKIRLTPDGEEIVLGFDDKAPSPAHSAERLRGAVRYGSPLRTKFLKHALDRCRNEGRKVIIFLGGDTMGEESPTQDAHYLLPPELHELGFRPEEIEVVTGDDPTSQKKIEQFGPHPTKWILISINMISEGTDIPEVSAGVFLTCITAKQTTVQRIGRPLRLMGANDPHPTALIFMFADPDLVELSKEIEKEIEQEINLKRRSREGSEGGNGGGGAHRAEAIGIREAPLKMVVCHEREWPASVFDKALDIVKKMGFPSTWMNAVAQLVKAEKDGNDQNH